MHTGMAEVCYCPVSLVYFQFLLLETLPPSLKLFYSIDHIAEAQGHHNLHLHQLAEVPHQPHSSRPLSRQHLTMSPLCGFSNPFRDQTLTKHPNCPSSFPKLTLCSQFTKPLEANSDTSQQPICTDRQSHQSDSQVHIKYTPLGQPSPVLPQ